MRKSDYTLLLEAEERGEVVSMDRVVERKRTDLNNRLMNYFSENMTDKNFNFTYFQDDVDDILFSINEYLTDNNIKKWTHELMMSHYNNGADIYLIPITDNLELKLTLVDEYYGQGHSETYVSFDRFVINDLTTKEDVDRLMEVLKTYFVV